MNSPVERPHVDMVVHRTLGLGLLLFAAVLAFAPHGLFGQARDEESPGEQIALDAYRDLIADGLAVLSADETPGDDQQFIEIRRWLARVESVILPSGQIVIVLPLLGSSDPSSGAQSNVPGRDVAIDRLATVLDQLARIDSDNTDERLLVLSEVLARPEFSRPESLWDRARHWLRDLVRTLWPERQIDPSQSSIGPFFQIVAWLTAGIGALLLALLLGQWLRGVLASFIVDVASRRQSGDAEQTPLTAVAARQRAITLAGAGDHRQAVRHLYLAALLLLEERGFIAYDRSQTNREVLDQVQRRPELHGQLAPVVDTFDEVWYGIRQPSAAVFTTYEQAIDDLTQTVMAEVDAGQAKVR